MVVSFDLFGTLVRAATPDDPAAAVAAELEACGVSVPGDWGVAYREPHVDPPAGAEVPLPAHASAALASRGVRAAEGTVREAVAAAFDPAVRTRDGATAAVKAAAERGAVGVLSNCSVPGLAGRALSRSSLPAFDAVVASVDCGWRKPDPRAFEAIARNLGAPVADLLHVGDDPATDGGAADAGATAVLLSDVPLSEIPGYLERCPR